MTLREAEMGILQLLKISQWKRASLHIRLRLGHVGTGDDTIDN